MYPEDLSSIGANRKCVVWIFYDYCDFIKVCQAEEAPGILMLVADFLDGNEPVLE